ncbi:4,4'-diaponeurosporenoate glycosyltransferase [Salimicrobium flavidum]|uniref:4,4'-diaponeurosporenoate glycosyltransferase n=2 Tax=Salimicrobium flavidum TaxID=570947 RepID=A0A1N7J916_9BACI|nr:4,4'-diaponeurosporenoate glycosyltransferase [Salimicrobium flavidum]
MFLDADTWVEEKGMERIVRYVEDNQVFLTVHPYHVMESFAEKFSDLFHSVVYASSGITSIGRKRFGIQGGFGPCVALPRSMYDSMGGHEVIKGEVTEHFEFLRKAKASGYPVEAFSGKGVLSMRMYQADIKEVAAGWSKSFASGAVSASPWTTVINVVWISSVLSFVTRMKRLGLVSLFGYGVLSAWLYRFWKDIGNFSKRDAMIFPVHFLFFITLFGYSAVRTFLFRQSTWKGRVIS